MASPTELTPQERLALSRKAIVRHMNRHHQRDTDYSVDDEPGEELQATASHGALGMIKHAARVWWHRNPASTIAQLAQPLVNDYARAHPFKLVGFSAAAGAAVVLIRPWRMVSLGTVLVAAVKSSGLSSALVSMISSVHSDNKDTTP